MDSNSNATFDSATCTQVSFDLAMHDPEEIFSGISVVLTVAPPPPEPEAASLARQLEAQPSNSPHVQSDDSDEADLMQVTSQLTPEPQAHHQGICRAQVSGLGFKPSHYTCSTAWSSVRRWNGRLRELDHPLR